MGQITHTCRLFFTGTVEVRHYRVAHVDGEQRFPLAEESAPPSAGPEGNHQGDNRKRIPIGHVERAYFERPERGIEFPATTLREDVNPLLLLMKFFQRLVKFPKSASFLGNSNPADGFHQKSVFAAERLGIHGNPGLAVAHRLQHANHIPSVDMVAHGHHPVGEKRTVPADFLTTYNLKTITDSVHRESDNPEDKIDEEMPYSEFQGFVKIGIRPVKFDVLEFPAYRSHSRERIVPRELLHRFRNISLFPDLEVTICRSK